jgi:hypothetical protein
MQVTSFRLSFSTLKTEAAGSSGTGVSVCFLCGKNWTFKYSIEFESGPDSVGFMVDKVELGQVYLRVLWFTTVIIIRVHINVPYSPSKINLIKRAGSTWGNSNKSGEHQGKKTLSFLFSLLHRAHPLYIPTRSNRCTEVICYSNTVSIIHIKTR